MDTAIAFLEQPNKSLPLFLKLLGTYGYLSGYKINVSKTQISTLNYIPSREIHNHAISFGIKEEKEIPGLPLLKDYQICTKQIMPRSIKRYKKTLKGGLLYL